MLNHGVVYQDFVFRRWPKVEISVSSGGVSDTTQDRVFYNAQMKLITA
jgi:hypothetical protein